MTVVIYGPIASGKTYHASRFMEHYGCGRVIEADPRVQEPIRDDDLILTNQGYVDAKHRFSEAHIVPVDEARLAIGLNPAPNGGFRPPYDQAPGYRTPAGPLPPFVQPTIAELLTAASIVGSQPVIAAYGACEWGELSQDGKVWIAAIVREATARANTKPGITAETIVHVNAFLTHMAERYRERTAGRCLGFRYHTMTRSEAMSLAVETFDANLDMLATWFGDPDYVWDQDFAHEMVDDDLRHWDAS